MDNNRPYPSNKYGKEDLIKRLDQEKFKRKTISFYRYVLIEDPVYLRNSLYREWQQLGCLGRIYIAREGINAQMNVPEPQWDAFFKQLNDRKEFSQMPIKYAVEEKAPSFLKLAIKVRDKIVADGLTEDDYDVTNVGKHLTAQEWNEALEKADTVVVDMRNFYESEVGHFEKAILPQAETFRDELPEVLSMLEDKKDKKILLYCTGGIRCEKTSAYLKHHGFEDVNQLHGGIIDYFRQIKEAELPNHFKGKNFVFDDRLGERITDDVIAHCHQCGQQCDTHVNCANEQCNLLFIQCSDCAEKYNHCCSSDCQEGKTPPPFEGKRRIFHRKSEV